MSMNQHEQLAHLRAGGVHEWQSDWGSTDATNVAAIIDALTEATLAVAYEQRTANMIALASMDPSVFGMSPASFFQEIDARLGIKPTA